MGRRSLAKAEAPNFWLPGFEPESVGEPVVASNPMVIAAAMPPSPPTAIAVASAQVAVEVLSTADPILLPQTRQALEVVGNEDIQLDEPAANESVLHAFEDVVEDNETGREWPAFDASRYAPPNGDMARIEANLRAITLAKELLATGMEPTDEQRHQLLQYAGWGGLARIFEDLSKNPLRQQQDRLRQLLSDEEFASARSSVTDAFYTDPVLVEAIWAALRRAGFQGGRVIEPTAGTGLFIAGMPADLAARSEITAVEKDQVTGQVLTAAFMGTGVHTHVIGLERAEIPHGFYDAVVSNVPFGEYRVAETRKVGYAGFSIHNWAIGKSLDLLRPGGIAAIITSRYTLDAEKSVHRKWFQAHAELLTAVRLPKGAFKRHAGTEVVTDILFLRKRERPKYDADASESWLKVGNAPLSMLAPGEEIHTKFHSNGRQCEHARPLNGYFVQRPGLVIGELVKTSGPHGSLSWLPHFKGSPEDFKARLADAVATIPAGIYTSCKPSATAVGASSLALTRVGATKTVKPGSFVLHGNRIHLSEGTEWVDVDQAYTGKARERVLGLMRLRDAARNVIDQQSQSQDESEFRRLQYALNTVYDAFVSAHGNVHDRANTRVFRTDPEFPLLLSLESYDEDNERFEKAAIFTKRTVGRREAPAHAESIHEALAISLAVHGRIVLADMAARLGCKAPAVVKKLEEDNLAFLDPEQRQWQPADLYLSGHIRNKIAAARAGGPKYSRNVVALQAVIPPDLGPGDVEIRLGAPWVPTDVVRDFIEGLIAFKASQYQQLEVSYDVGTATWSVKPSGQREYVGDRTLNTNRWGTSDRTAIDLVEAALNQVPPKITRTTSTGGTYVDKRATLAAREKYEAIRQEFRSWAYAEEKRRDRLLRIYNDQFNQVVETRYNGGHLLLPGMSGVIVPYQHQLDAIWRVIIGGNTLLWHCVGAGKTFTMAASCMEMRRLGKAAKPCVVTPNHLLSQVVGDFVRFYPNANVLMASKEDFEGDKRREFCARIATGDWDAVVMTMSTFERLALRPATQARFIEDILQQARLALNMAQDSDARRSVKQCEKVIKAFEARLERAAQSGAKDDLVYFDDLGIDFICYDEAHAAKNLMRISKMPPIAGLPNASSNRAFDLWMKSSLLMEARGGREEGLVLSTATPISNSVAEGHVMLRLLIPQTLKRMGLYEFDAWAATFGEAVTGMEVAPDGSGYRLNTRFSRFSNLPELMSVFRLCADIRTREMVKLKVPAVKGGKPQVITCEASSELKAYTEGLVKRAEKIRNGGVEPSEDNMLAVTNCGRKAALDMRLVAPGLKPDRPGKIVAVRDEILRIWHESAAKRGTQIAFCDLSTPKAVAFSFYVELRKLLLEAGIPGDEIEFIHDHDSDTAKDKLFRRMRAGSVRVLLGSTAKLGTGTNVQKRLKALHDCDLPWRPSDLEQRGGRGLRPGNEWDEIEMIRYVTEGSFDAYMAQTLEVKARFIEQLTAAAPGVRSIEDISMGALSFAEIKAIASGNPLVLEKATVDAEILKLSTLRSTFEDERWRLSTRKTNLQQAIDTIDRHRDGYAQDAAVVKDQTASGWVFAGRHRVEASGSVVGDIGRHLRVTSNLMGKQWGEVVVGEVAGWEIVLQKRSQIDIVLQSLRTGMQLAVDREHVTMCDEAGLGAAVLRAIAAMADLPERQDERQRGLRGQLVELEKALGAGFEHEERLRTLEQRQREIESMLDLDKDAEGTATAGDSGKAAVEATAEAEVE